MKSTGDFGLLSGLAAVVPLDTPRLREHGVDSGGRGLSCATGESMSLNKPFR